MIKGIFYKNKTVAVIGGSDCAAVDALSLTDIAKKIYVLYRGKKLRCEYINAKRLEENKKVKVIYNVIPKEIKGKNKVESLIIKNDRNQTKEIKLDGIFVDIGSVPLTEFSKKLNLKLDKENYIIVDENMKTSVPGIFAAGDITNFKLKQIVISASQGAIAAKSAYEYLKSKD